MATRLSEGNCAADDLMRYAELGIAVWWCSKARHIAILRSLMPRHDHDILGLPPQKVYVLPKRSPPSCVQPGPYRLHTLKQTCEATGRKARASSPHCTVWKEAASSGWAAVLATYVARGVLVAMPISTPWLRRWRSSRAAPGSSRAWLHLRAGTKNDEILGCGIRILCAYCELLCNHDICQSRCSLRCTLDTCSA